MGSWKLSSWIRRLEDLNLISFKLYEPSVKPKFNFILFVEEFLQNSRIVDSKVSS